MRFWDSSAIVPLLVDEASSAWARSLLDSDDGVVASWAARIECVSAIARRERDDELAPGDVSVAMRELDAMASAWTEVAPSDTVRAQARRLLRVHPLRAGDALQLAAALIAAEGHPPTLPLVSLDERLAIAAEREGLPVVRHVEALPDPR